MKKFLKWGCLISILINVPFIIAAIIFHDDSKTNNTENTTSVEVAQEDTINYYDESKSHKEEAYRAVKHEVINNLKDPDSYESVQYGVTFSKTRKAYIVILKYRANNSFGGKVVEQVRGYVKFDEETGEAYVEEISQL